MAVLWSKSRTFERDGNTDAPIQGAKAYFFDAATTTPKTVYTDSAFSVPHNHPVVALGAGKWPAVYLQEGMTYRQRITTSAGVTVSDDDGISVPTTEPPDFPESDTPPEQIAQTGTLEMRWSATPRTGWVRVNGRTIGSAASGATERANADCENLFIFLWNNDSSLAVSGGRGGTATGDWAADKTIALPDPRGCALVVLDSFGNSAAGRVTDAVLGEDSDTLGSRGGSQTHVLTLAQLPADPPTGTVSITDPKHRHMSFVSATVDSPGLGAGSSPTTANGGVGDRSYTISGSSSEPTVGRTSEEATGITAGFTGDDLGSGEAHNNLQPTIMIPLFIKL